MCSTWLKARILSKLAWYGCGTILPSSYFIQFVRRNVASCDANSSTPMRAPDDVVLHLWRRTAHWWAAQRARRPDGAWLGAIGKKITRDPILVKSQWVNEINESTNDIGKVVYSRDAPKVNMTVCCTPVCWILIEIDGYWRITTGSPSPDHCRFFV